MSLAKKLQSEMKANPVKAGGLGVLLVVAGYFWTPLVKGYIFHAQTAPVPVATADGAPQGTPMPAVAQIVDAPKAPEQSVYDWPTYAQRIDDDVKMRSVIELPNARDPFESPHVKPLEEAAATIVPAPKAADSSPLDPRDAGLVLSSTFVGPRKQIALIGGKPYQIGDRVRAQKDGLKATFTLIDVQPRLIVLERKGKQYELAITRGHSNDAQVVAPADNQDDEDEDESPESEMIPDGPAGK